MVRPSLQYRITTMHVRRAQAYTNRATANKRRFVAAILHSIRSDLCAVADARDSASLHPTHRKDGHGDCHRHTHADEHRRDLPACEERGRDEE